MPFHKSVFLFPEPSLYSFSRHIGVRQEKLLLPDYIYPRFYQPPGLPPGPPPPGIPPPPGVSPLPTVVTTLLDVKVPTCEPPDHVPPAYHPFHESV